MKTHSIKNLVLGAAALSALVFGGCLNDSNSGNPDQKANLVISFGVKDVASLTKKGLSKSADIQLKKLIITMTSSVGGDSVLRDTIVASDTLGSSFKSNAMVAQQVLKNYQVRPLRNYTVQVKTLDVKDSVIHVASATALNIKVGEVRPITLNLTAKFVVYAAKFTLPDSIGSISGPGKQKLYIKRFKVTLDGITVADSSYAYFLADTAHMFNFDYVRADTAHSIGLFVYADSLGSWDPNKPIFADTIAITSTDTTYHPELPWTGPGSPSDPDYDPSNPGGAKAGLIINIGAVGRVLLDNTVNPNPVPKRR